LITLGAITQVADRDGVDAHVVERDYLLTHLGLVPDFERQVRELRRALRAKLI